MDHEVAKSIAMALIHPISHETYSWQKFTSLNSDELARADDVGLHKHSSNYIDGSSGIGSTESEFDSLSAGKGTFTEEYIESAYKPTTNLQESAQENDSFRPTNPASYESFLLGSSAHLQNFKSPKVSDNFCSLVSINHKYRECIEV